MNQHKRTIRTLSHSFYDLKYHLVWTPKSRGKVLGSDHVKNELRRIFEAICRWKHWEIIELSIQENHIHLCLLATPRDSVSYVMQMLKGKSSAWMKKKIKRTHGLYEKESLWARGYFVSTIGLDENIITRYVKHQHHKNQVDQPSLFDKLIKWNTKSRPAGLAGKPKATGPQPSGRLLFLRKKIVLIYFQSLTSVMTNLINSITSFCLSISTP